MSKILIAITGGIAAYKTAELVRLLKKENHEVKVIMTDAATKIISPLTLQVLSQQSVRIDLFDQQQEEKIDHISLARWPDQIIIAPATANTIAKLATGICDNLLTTVCLATTAPISFAPAMNKEMYAHPATQTNIQKLIDFGYTFIPPENGFQACGETGIGRMAEPVQIIQHLKPEQTLNGLRILITAGPTIERIDPVRFISNDSSGKMGYAIANQAISLGAEVTLISGKVHCHAHPNINLIRVESADEMHQVVMQHTAKNDWFIGTAAVSDYKPKTQSSLKIKKQKDQTEIQLHLIPNIDILQSVCSLKRKLFCVGFAAETNNLVAYAKEKLVLKGADFICANDVSQKDIGFNSDENSITIIGKKTQEILPKMKKSDLAKKLLLYLNTHYIDSKK